MSNAGGELSGPQRTASHFSVGAASRVGCNGLLGPAPAVSRSASTRGRASSWRDDNVLDLRHVATSGGGGLLRSVPARLCTPRTSPTSRAVGRPPRTNRDVRPFYAG